MQDAALVKVCQKLGLPEPSYKDIFYADPAEPDFYRRSMLFVPQMGIVITAQNIPSDVKHPLVYEPIAQFQVDGRTVEIIPLRHPMKKEKHYRQLLRHPKRYEMDESYSPVLSKLRDTLADHDINLKDGAVRNAARMNQRTEAFPHGIPEVIDKGSVHYKARYDNTPTELFWLRRELEEFKDNKEDPRWARYNELIRQQPYPDRVRDVGYHQLKCEGEFPDAYSFAKDMVTDALRHHFDQAWPPEKRHELAGDPDQVKMGAFWKACIGMTQNPPAQPRDNDPQKGPDAEIMAKFRKATKSKKLDLLASDTDWLPKEAKHYAKKLKKCEILIENAPPERHR
ncbi:MAG: hypothetical protein K2Q01_10885 [Rickettsiales bacterium]|nr:hypothetical protein [Rickettsiales bacterium]